jgi:hypothetical protein
MACYSVPTWRFSKHSTVSPPNALDKSVDDDGDDDGNVDGNGIEQFSAPGN